MRDKPPAPARTDSRRKPEPRKKRVERAARDLASGELDGEDARFGGSCIRLELESDQAQAPHRGDSRGRSGKRRTQGAQDSRVTDLPSRMAAKQSQSARVADAESEQDAVVADLRSRMAGIEDKPVAPRQNRSEAAEADFVERDESSRGRRTGSTRRSGAKAAEREERRQRKAAEVARDPEAHAKDICLTLLTARPRTRSELYKALLRNEISPEVAERVLGRLDEVGLIDDKAFAEMWVRSRHTYQGMGRKALSVELRRRGVDNDTVAEAVAAVDEESEEERAGQLVRKKLPSMRSADEQTKIRRLVGMLARKGYSQGLAYRVVRNELANFGEETDLLDTFE